MGATPDGPRLPPISPQEWPAEMREALAALRPANPRHPFPPSRDDRPKGLNALGLLAHHPQLTTAFHTLVGHVLFGSTLTPRDRELLVLRVAALRDATYEWEQHAVLAGDAGLTAEEIARLREGPGAPGWSSRDQALVRAVDELIADARIGDATWDALELDDQQRMDLVFTVGTYEALAMAFKTFDVELDDDLKRS